MSLQYADKGGSEPMKRSDWVLYGTSGCHLCELAVALVAPALQARAESWWEADIAENDQLVALYGVRIPVLRHVPSAAELGWPFDAETLERWLDGLAGRMGGG